MARLGGQVAEVRGTLTDLTDLPSRHDKPIQLRLTSAGAVPLELQATIDRTGSVARDELLCDCRGIIVPKLSLGQVDELSLALSPSSAAVSISVLAEGEKLSGNIQLTQKQVHLVPVLSGQLTDLPIVAALQSTLADFDAVATRITLSGTLSKRQSVRSGRILGPPSPKPRSARCNVPVMNT
jgi:hypothetical protein